MAVAGVAALRLAITLRDTLRDTLALRFFLFVFVVSGLVLLIIGHYGADSQANKWCAAAWHTGAGGRI